MSKLTGFRKIAAIGLMGIAGLVGCASPSTISGNSLPLPGVSVERRAESAEDKTSCGCEQEHLCSIRAREEITYSNGQGTSKTTLGLAPCVNGKHGDEYFRTYEYRGLGDLELDYTAAAGTIPSFKLGQVDNSLTLFGTFGDKQGLGIESRHSLDNWTLNLNAEKSANPEATRFGFGLDKKVSDKLTLGGAIDHVNTGGEDTNYFLAHGIYDASENNQFGLGLRADDSEQDMKSVIGYWGHYGKDEKWGTRSYLRGDFGNDIRSFTLDSIIAQNPTFSRFSSPWIVGRNRGDMFDVGVVEDALSPERVPLGERTKGGLFGEIKANLTESGDRKGYVKFDTGYRFNNVDFGLGKIDVAPLVFYRHGLGKDEGRSLGVGGLVKLGKGFCLEASGSHNFGGKPEFYMGIQYSCPIGNPLRH
jgi:hypothetical protein